MHGAAAAQASGFGDEERELRERRLEAAEAIDARAVDHGERVLFRYSAAHWIACSF